MKIEELLQEEIKSNVLRELEEIYNEFHDELFVSFTDISKLGINPKSKHATPLGIYSYPLGYYVLKLRSVPYAEERPTIQVFNQLGNTINNKEYSQSDLQSDKEKLLQLYFNDYKESLMAGELELFTDKAYELVRHAGKKYEVKELLEDALDSLNTMLSKMFNEIGKKEPIIKVLGTVFSIINEISYNPELLPDIQDTRELLTIYSNKNEIFDKDDDDISIVFSDFLDDKEEEDLTREEFNYFNKLVKQMKSHIEEILKNLDTRINSDDFYDLMMDDVFSIWERNALVKSPLGKLWNITRETSNAFSEVQKRKSIIIWNSIFREGLEIDAVIDYGDAIIHVNEPIQAVHFSRGTLEHIETIHQNKQQFNVPKLSKVDFLIDEAKELLKVDYEDLTERQKERLATIKFALKNALNNKEHYTNFYIEKIKEMLERIG